MSIENNLAPVLLLDGRENTLAIVRAFHGYGIPVTVATYADCAVYKSRYLKKGIPIPEGVSAVDHYRDITLSGKYPELKGSVIFACGDSAIDFMIEARDELEKDFILDCQIPSKQLDMLNKRKTLELAEQVGIEAPKFWFPDELNDLQKIADTAVYPVLIKPIFTHLFQKHYDKKLLLVDNKEDLLRWAQEVKAKQIEFMICEFIPGPDTCNSSYYTHIDAKGNNLFKYTKRVIRRTQPNFGGGCYHESKWLPDTAKEGEKYFRGIGFTGLCNIEFKHDARDNKLKLIEVNARITAAHEILVKSNMDVAYLVYCHLTGRAVPKLDSFKEYVTLWYPIQDIDSYRCLRREGKITFAAWVRSWLRWHQFPFFAWHDPLPSIVQLYWDLKARLFNRLGL